MNPQETPLEPEVNAANLDNQDETKESEFSDPLQPNPNKEPSIANEALTDKNQPSTITPTSNNTDSLKPSPQMSHSFGSQTDTSPNQEVNSTIPSSLPVDLGAPIVFSPSSGEESANTTNPVSVDTNNQPISYPLQGAIVSSNIDSESRDINDRPKHKIYKKLIFLVVLFLALLTCGGLVAYFGFYMNPNFIWSQGLGDMNTAYVKLINYANTESGKSYQGINLVGSFKGTSGSAHYNGSFSDLTYKTNSIINANLDTGTMNLGLNVLTIAPSGVTTPDVYFKITGLQYLSQYISPAATSLLNNQWIVVDHNLISDLDSSLIKTEKSTKKAPHLSWATVYSFLKSSDSINQKYLFSANPKYAILKVLKKYGFETINGNRTYHYKVGFNKTNLKNYIVAMCSAFKNSQFGNYVAQQAGGNASINNQCSQMEASTNQITPKDTIDVWMNVNSRLLYKVRISQSSNPSLNFVDIGLNYQSSHPNTIPLFINEQSVISGGKTSLSVTATLYEKLNKVDVNFNMQSKSSSSFESFSGNLSISPNLKVLNIVAPANAQPIIPILNRLGLGGMIPTAITSQPAPLQAAYIPTNSVNYRLTALLLN